MPKTKKVKAWAVIHENKKGHKYIGEAGLEYNYVDTLTVFEEEISALDYVEENRTRWSRRMKNYVLPVTITYQVPNTKKSKYI